MIRVLVVCLSLCISLFAAEDAELRQIVEQARQSGHPWVCQALQEEQEFRESTTAELQSLMRSLQTLAQTAPELAKELPRQVPMGLAHDLERIAVLTHYTDHMAPIPIQTHKLKEATLGALELARQPGVIEGLLQGHLPQGYGIEQHHITQLGENNDTIFGNSKGTFLKTVLFKIYLALKQASHFQDLEPGITTSALCHKTPGQFSQAALVDIGDVPYVCATGLYYPHSGYALGGSRSDPVVQRFAPQDCSSFVSHIVHCPFAFTTADEWECYNATPQWAKTRLGQAMLKLLTSAPVADPARDIGVGHIYCTRSADHGHTAIIIGQRRNGKLVTLGCNRNMPHMEGFGVEEFRYHDTPQRRMFFLQQAQPH